MTTEQDQQAGAYALEQAAKDLERMYLYGATPRKDLKDREWEEYQAWAAFDGDIPAWLRSRTGKATRTAPPREYGVAVKMYSGARGWRYPDTTLVSLRDARDSHDHISSHIDAGTAGYIIAAKVVSRTKPGTWEFEEQE